MFIQEKWITGDTSPESAVTWPEYERSMAKHVESPTRFSICRKIEISITRVSRNRDLQFRVRI